MYYTLFETSLGICGIAWNDRGVRMLQLPEGRRGQAEARLRRIHSQAVLAPPLSWVQDAILRVTAHLAGDRQDFSAVPVDPGEISPFDLQLFQLARAIPAGTWKTYGDLASLTEKPGNARAVARAMEQNPIPLIIPCHRVIAARGKPGRFTAAAGVISKTRLLAFEGVDLASVGLRLFEGNDSLPYSGDEAINHLRRVDPVLANTIDRVGPFRLELSGLQSPFGALAESIVYQQLTGKAAATIHGRLIGLCHPRRRLKPEDIVRFSEAQLRSAGLSRAKVAALKDLAVKTQQGVVPTMAQLKRMEDGEIIERLTSIRGIGQWTVEMLLIFRLGRPDILPVTDYGVQKGFKQAYRKRKLPKPAQLAQYGRRWAPYRSVAAWYLWRVVDQAK